MQRTRLGLLLLVLLAGALSARAQERVSGRVVDGTDRSPLPGVNVAVSGTTAGTATDADGRYSLTLPAGADTLVFSYIGYETREVAIAGRSVIDVTLEPVILSGEEVLVVGYTAERRRTVTGAVASVTPEALETRKVATLEEALKGRIPGVEINTTGEPGEGAQISIRGLNFMGSNEPLYVVDGMYLRSNPNLDPDEIASIQVLKDASAASQYGSQAASGVIVITTRRGQSGENRITFDAYYGMQQVPRTIDMMNAAEWARVNRMAYENAGLPPMGGALNPAADTDWQDALFQRGAIQNYSLQISGGTPQATYLVSGGYVNQDGAVIETGFERYNLRVNTELQRGILTIGETASLSRSLKDNMVGFPLIDAVRMLPSIPVYDPSRPSGYGYGDDDNYTFGTNPIGAQELEDNRNTSNQALGTLYAELGFLRNLRYRFNLGFQYEDFRNRTFIRRGVIRLNNPDEPARLWENRNQFSSLLWENLLTFEDEIGPHAVNAVAGITEQRSTIDRVIGYGEGFPDEDIATLSAATGRTEADQERFVHTLRSFLVRANYGFADRYLLTASFRRDGSSRFGPANRWGNFVAGSVGWVLSEEGFYASIPLLGRYVDFFKLRASYGNLGNQDIGDYAYAAAIRANIGYPFGGGGIFPGSTQLDLANPNIKWQDNTQFNAGVDLNLLNYRLSVTADYYVSESGGLLVQAPLPWSVGSGAAPYVNAGTIRNSGFELGASYRIDRGDFELTTSANLTTIKNEVISLGNNAQPIFAGSWGVTRTAVGGSLGAFYVLKTDGLFQSEADVQAHTTTLSDGTTVVIQPNAKPGDIRYADLSGPDGVPDGVINDFDRYVAGSAFPDVQGGVFFDGRYRDFDFTVALRYSVGAEIFNGARFWTDRLDDNANYRAGLEPWTPENPNTDTPRAVFGAEGAMNANPVTDRWIEDGSYLRIQNIEFGYRLPAPFTQRLGLRQGGLRLYVNLQNLYTFTGYSGWDPENIGSGGNLPVLSRGVDDGQIFPNVRSYTVGLNLTL